LKVNKVVFPKTKSYDENLLDRKYSIVLFTSVLFKQKQTPWPESASELYRLSDRRLLAKSVPTFEDGGVSLSQIGGSPTAVITVFLDRSH
jgi:hypothetical protein